MSAQEKIKEYFNTEWNFVDFFYAYCASKGIDDPEEDLTEEEYSRLERECEEKISVSMLARLRDTIIADINERLTMIW